VRWRLTILGMLVSLSLAAPAAAVPPAPVPLLIYGDGGGGCYVLGDPVKVVIGGSILFNNNDSNAHTVHQRESFWSLSIPADGDKVASIHASGSYSSRCDDGPYELTSKTPVKAPGNPGMPDFKVTWADADAGGAWTYDVQYRIGPDWGWWRRSTSARSANFHGIQRKTYYFRARVTRAGETTGWSPPKKVTT
jgi:hypothetical protein